MQTHRRARSEGPATQHARTAQEPEALPVRLTDGVLVLSGYGLRVAVERGHLAVSDGTGAERRSGLLHRATSGLRRLVVHGHAGTVSLDALKWLADVRVPFVQIDHDGNLVAVTAPLGSDDARMRRAQALATTNGVGLELARSLLREKVERQRALLDRLSPTGATRAEVDRAAELLALSATIDGLRLAESRAALAYWASWTALDVRFAKRDEPRVPAHWRRFDARSSPIANGPRLAVSPVNALLNYLYGILEAETRIACLAVGLDPGMGVLHADQRGRDSFALDLMEPLRPRVDELVLDLLAKRIFAAKDFFETVQGNCRLMPTLTKPLAEYAPQLARWIAPHAECAVRRFGRQSDSRGERSIATPLTQHNRSRARDGVRGGPRIRPRELSPLSTACKECGVILEDSKRIWCPECYAFRRVDKDRANIAVALEVKAQMGSEGRDPAQSEDARAKRRATRIEQRRLELEWKAANPGGASEDEFRARIFPGLESVTVNALAKLMGVSIGYAAQVKMGKRVPHPRHWVRLRFLLDQ